MNIPVMSKDQASWFAAALDGEGTLGLYYQLDKKTGKKYPRFHLVIANTNLEFLEHARAVSGVGCICATKREAPRKLVYQFQINGRRKVTPVLLQISPYLIIKRAVAQKMLVFDAKHQWYKHDPSVSARNALCSWKDPTIRQRRLEGMVREAIKRRKRITKTCCICGSTFWVPECRQNSAKYCSKKCLYERGRH